MNHQFNAHGVEMGQRYASDAVVGDGTPFPPSTRDPELHYHPTTHPGAYLPHVWLQRGTEDVSTLDLCGYDRFTLITGIGGDRWHEAAAQVTSETGVTINPVMVGLGQTNNDVLGTWTRMRETADAGCVLVRPDRVVAWRCPGEMADPTAALGNAMRQILGRHV
jgi:2,4-dichlorophenol 6-monooxygenase